MKIIITENRLEKAVIHWLNDNYGNLEEYYDEKFMYFFSGNDIIFDYHPINNRVIISDVLWDDVRLWFSLTYDEASDVLTKWVSQYVDVTEIRKFGGSSFRRWSEIESMFK